MLRAAESYGVDLVCGQTRRFDVETEKWSGWHARLYREPKTLERISEWVELIIDSNSTAKLIRRVLIVEKNLTFPEDIHYEDLVYTANLYSYARGIHIIPEIVYVWKVYPKDTRKSITNQRDDLKNLKSRLSAFSRIHRDVYPNTDLEVQRRFDLKFLRHDARLYLNDLKWCNNEHALQVFKLVNPVLRKISFDIYKNLTPGERCLYAAALSESPRLVRSALRMASNKVAVSGYTNISADGISWVGDAKDSLSSDGLVKKLIDIRDTRLHESLWTSTTISHEIQEVEKSGDGFTFNLKGTSFVQLISLPPLNQMKFELSLIPRRNAWAEQRFPVKIQENSDGILSWEANFMIPNAPMKSNNMTYDIRLVISNEFASNISPIFADRQSKITNSVVGKKELFARLSGTRFKVVPDAEGMLIIRQTEKGIQKIERYRRAISLQRKIARWKNGQINNNSRLWRAVYGFMRMMPLRGNVTLFESHMGRSISDSPGSISRELHRQIPSMKQVWSVANKANTWNVEDETVIRGSIKYLWNLATAKYLVDNQTLPVYFKKREGQIYLQTWHGIPLKTMGFDEPSIKRSSKQQQQLFRKRVGYWNYLNVPSDYFASTFVPAYEFSEKMIRGGLPRNDALVDGIIDQDQAREKLGINTDRKVVLYTPTFRNRGRTTLGLDINSWVEDLGQDTILLVRAHSLNRIRIPKHLSGVVVDVSDIDDVNLLYLASDMMITDYSSTMFDYSLVDKPIILYVYDYDEYVGNLRGTYFDLRENAPGELVNNMEDLVLSVQKNLIDDPFRNSRHKFRDSYLGLEDGTSSARTVAEVWGN